jgi:hypothetical protein
MPTLQQSLTRPKAPNLDYRRLGRRLPGRTQLIDIYSSMASPTRKLFLVSTDVTRVFVASR